MIIQWCEETPCKGPMCPSALARYGQATFGHTIPVPPDPHDRGAIADLMAKHLSEAVIRDEQGVPHTMPPGFEFTIHHMVMTDGRQYYTALYSGKENPLPILSAAPVAEPTDARPPAPEPYTGPAPHGPVEDAVEPADRWPRPTPGARTEPPELDKPPVASQPRQW